MGHGEMIAKCTVITIVIPITYMQRILSPQVTLCLTTKSTMAVVENKRSI